MIVRVFITGMIMKQQQPSYRGMPVHTTLRVCLVPRATARENRYFWSLAQMTGTPHRHTPPAHSTPHWHTRHHTGTLDTTLAHSTLAHSTLAHSTTHRHTRHWDTRHRHTRHRHTRHRHTRQHQRKARGHWTTLGDTSTLDNRVTHLRKPPSHDPPET